MQTQFNEMNGAKMQATRDSLLSYLSKRFNDTSDMTKFNKQEQRDIIECRQRINELTSELARLRIELVKSRYEQRTINCQKSQ